VVVLRWCGTVLHDGVSCLGGSMTVKDPVCSMKIEQEDAVGSAEHEGTTYYFCSEDCKEEFEADPSGYAG